MNKKSKVIAIAAPTATGKSKFAVELAHKYDGEVVSADSRLVYKGFEVAVAKPTLEEREGIPHHVIDVVEPEINYTVANFYDDDENINFDNRHKKNMTRNTFSHLRQYVRVLRKWI